MIPHSHMIVNQQEIYFVLPLKFELQNFFEFITTCVTCNQASRKTATLLLDYQARI